MSELPAWATQNNSDYLQERVRRYNEAPSDDLLYRIGSCMDTFTSDDEKLLRRTGYSLTPEQRYRVLNQLLCNGFKIECDLALLIFGRQQLTQWLEISRQAYPNFEFYLAFEYYDRKVTRWESGVYYTCFWMPKPGAPTPTTDNDFPWKLRWELGEMFWSNFPNSTTNDFEFTLSVYPNQWSFTDSNWILEEDDWQCIPTDQEADLMSVAQVLQHFAVPA